MARSLKLRTTQTLGLIITDIENPFFPQLGRWAVERLVERLAEVTASSAEAGRRRNGEPIEMVLPVRLVARGSSGPPPGVTARVAANVV